MVYEGIANLFISTARQQKQNQPVFPVNISKHLHVVRCGITTMIQKL